MPTKQHLQITQRDVTALLWIGQAGVASLDQLARRLWQGQLIQARARLRLLGQAGYLQTHHCQVRGVIEQVYSLRSGATALVAEHEPAIGLPRANLLGQQLRLQEIYLWLDTTLSAAGHALIAWQTEYALQYQLRRGRRLGKGQRNNEEIPDGRVVFTTAGGQLKSVDIEIDGQYYGQYLHTKMTTYSRQSTPLLWVCPLWRVPTVGPLLRGHDHLAIIILEDTPDARPYCLSTDPAGTTGGLPWADHRPNLHALCPR